MGTKVVYCECGAKCNVPDVWCITKDKLVTVLRAENKRLNRLVEGLSAENNRLQVELGHANTKIIQLEEQWDTACKRAQKVLNELDTLGHMSLQLSLACVGVGGPK